MMEKTKRGFVKGKRMVEEGGTGLLEGYVWVKYNLNRSNLKAVLLNERGDVNTVSILGWAAVVITLIVAAHGLLTGWLPDFINSKIIDRANSL